MYVGFFSDRSCTLEGQAAAAQRDRMSYVNAGELSVMSCSYK